MGGKIGGEPRAAPSVESRELAKDIMLVLLSMLVWLGLLLPPLLFLVS